MSEENNNPIERRESGGGIGRRSDVARRGMIAANYVRGVETGLKKQSPRQPKSVQEWIDRGNEHLGASRWQEAIDCYDNAIEMGSEDPTLYRNRGIAHVELERYGRAIEDLNCAFRLGGDDQRTYFWRGRAYIQVLHIPSGVVQAHLANSDLTFQDGDLERAIEDLGKAISLDPEDAQAYYWRALALPSRSDFSEDARSLVMEDLNQAILLNPNYAKAYRERGRQYDSWMNDSKSAITDYTRAIELDPKDTQPYLDRANLYVRLNWYEQAIQDLDLVLSFDPENWDAYHERARAYQGLEQYEQAIQDLSQALSGDGNRWNKAMDYRSRGLIYHRLGQYEAAIQDFDRSIEQYLRPVVYQYRSTSLRALGRIEEADEDLSRYEKLRRN